MKVSMSANYKQFFTIEDVQIAKQMIKELKEEESTVTEYAEMAARTCDFGSQDIERRQHEPIYYPLHRHRNHIVYRRILLRSLVLTS